MTKKNLKIFEAMPASLIRVVVPVDNSSAKGVEVHLSSGEVMLIPGVDVICFGKEENLNTIVKASMMPRISQNGD